MSRPEEEEAHSRADEAGERQLRYLALIIAIVAAVLGLVAWTLVSLQPMPPW